MSNQRFSPEFKDEAVRQIVDRGYSVAEVSERLGVSAHSLYKWVKAVKPDKILVIDIISRQIIGEYEAGDLPDGIGYSSLVVGSGAGE